MRVRLVCIIYAAVLVSSTTAKAFDHGIPPAEVLRILEQTKFRVVRRVSEIPVQPLIASKFLPPNRLLSSFLADRGKPFQSGTHALMDDTRPMRQLIFAGISPDHIVLCFFHADWPADVRYMSLIRLNGPKAKEVFFCTLDGYANSLFEVRQLFRASQFSVLGLS